MQLSAVVACAVVSGLFLETKTPKTSPGPALAPKPWGEKWTLPYRQEMENYQNTQYSAELMIGPTPIRGILDTGSFELLVLSDRCDMCRNQPYAHGDSATYRKNGELVQHVFGSGPTQSMKGYEQISVGPMTAPNQTFYEIVQHNIPVLEFASFTAIVGIGAGSMGEKSLLESFKVTEFSVCLERANNAPGWLTWGGELTKEQKTDEAVALRVEGEHHWAVTMTAFAPQTSSGSAGEMSLCATGCAAILDSGTSLIAAPTEALMALSMLLPAIEQDCSNLGSLPDIVFTLDGKDLVLPPEAYVMRIQGTLVEAKSLWDLLYFKPTVQNLDQCVPAFMQMDRMTEMGPLWILGMPFFRYYHSTFVTADKVADRRVYLSNAGDACEALPLQVNKTSTATSEASSLEFSFVKARSAKNAKQRVPLTIKANAIVPPMVRGKDFLKL